MRNSSDQAISRTALATLIFAAIVRSAAAEGVALSQQEIVALVAGKSLNYRNDKRAVGPPGNPTRWEVRSDGSHAIVSLALREDHSVRVRCTQYARGGSTSPCAGMSANDVGIWSVESGALCIKWLNWGSSVPRCYRLLREASGYRAQQISGGPSSLDGALATVK